jgi:hypothetical protein
MMRCEATVERDGRIDVCNDEAIAIRLTDLDGGQPWPACDAHASPARYIGDGQWVHP